MTKEEFLTAVKAYLEGNANSYQELILEDYYDSFTFELNILDLLPDAEVEHIKNRVFMRVIKRIQDMNLK